MPKTKIAKIALETHGERLTRHSEEIVALSEAQREMLRILSSHEKLFNGDPSTKTPGIFQLISDLERSMKFRDETFQTYQQERQQVSERILKKLDAVERHSVWLWVSNNKIASTVILGLLVFILRNHLDPWIQFFLKLFGLL